MIQQMTSHLCLLLLSIPALSSNLGLEDVFFSPQDQTVREGEGIFFQCVSGESSPPATISWLKDGEVVARGQQIQGEFGGGHQKKTSGTLHLFNVTLEDDGKYVCVTRNPLLNISSKSKPAKLTVLGVPRQLQIIQGPDNITVAMGTEVSMHCAVRGFPVPMVHWFKNGDHLRNCSALCRLQSNGQLLIFRNVTKEDEGSYHCEASNQKETVKSQPAFLILAEMDWSFMQQPLNLTVKTGENVTVTCRPPHSRPAADVSWFKDNQLLAPTPSVTVLPSGDLFFHSIQGSDSGSYFCRASNIHLQRFLSSRRATVTVLAPPSVTLWPQLLTVPVGARVALECQVSGHPLPSISWIKRGHVRQTGGKVSLGLRNATLRFQSARSYDEGVYVCEASNALGQSRSTATLRVAVSPIIVDYMGQVSCRVGTSVVLPCRAVGILPITYTWTRRRAETQPPVRFSGGRHIDEEGALHISSVQWSDGGEYYCTAENRAGRHQRRTILTVTAADHPADRGEQTRLVLSASINTTRELPTHHSNVQSQHMEAACSSSICDATTHGATTSSAFSGEALAELKVSHRSPGPRSDQHLIQLKPNQTQLLVTLTQHPPASLQSFQSGHHRTQLRTTGASLFRLTVVSQTTESSVTQPTSKLQVDGPFGFLNIDSYSQSLTKSLVTQPMMSHSGAVIQSHVSQTQSHQTITQSQFYKSSREKPSTLVSQTKLETPSHPLPLQYSPTLAEKPQPHPQQSFTLSYLPKFHELLANQPNLLPTQLPPSATTPHPTRVHSQSSTTLLTSAVFTLPQSQPQPPPAQNTLPSISTVHPRGQTSNPTTPNPEIPVVPRVNMSERVNVTLQGDSTQSATSSNNTELTEWLKRNTSQSPMTSNDPRVMQHSPSWLPVVEKHDIPIVVGVGVSLAFIFITVTFYSVVQKNEPAPTSRAAQRNLGVPIRHAERRAAGRTYENRAFEDDDCVAVIEQSPNTSDTRARPPGPSLVTVQMEPTSEELQDDPRPSLDNHSITVETYPEPILDTKIDPFLDEEKGCSLSQPSIRLQCDEDWTSNRGDSRSPCPDALPPPSSLPSRSPSPSPPSKREEGLHSSLTLQSPEQCVAPIHHSLSISHGNPPLLLSHHVSLGLTTVAVDVHFYPAATASMTVGTSTHINSVPSSSSVGAPLFTPPLANSRETEQSAGRFHDCK